jgi:hypothetical protein
VWIKNLSNKRWMLIEGAGADISLCPLLGSTGEKQCRRKLSHEHIKISGDGMMMFMLTACVQCYVYSNFMSSHHWWYKLLLFKRLNNRNAVRTFCHFICNSMPFLLSHLYWVSRKSTQPHKFPFHTMGKQKFSKI